jgi:serine/threonine protein kinase
VYTYKQGIKWCIQIAEGLQRLHNGSPMIIHRDLKLDNILLAGERYVPAACSSQGITPSECVLHALLKKPLIATPSAR